MRLSCGDAGRLPVGGGKYVRRVEMLHNIQGARTVGAGGRVLRLRRTRGCVAAEKPLLTLSGA